MKRIEEKTRKMIRRFFQGISLTAVAFVFQACYGPGPDRYHDVKLTGTVTSKTTNLPIKGIKIAVNDGLNYTYSDENGKFDFFASNIDLYSQSKMNVHFLDIDGIENGHFADLTKVIDHAGKNEVKIDVKLEDFE